jgi:hypothetical protein
MVKAAVLIKQEEIISAHGFSVILTINNDGLPYCYTVGRAEQHLPELAVFGIQENGRVFLNEFAKVIKSTEDKYYQRSDDGAPCYAAKTYPDSEIAEWAHNRQKRFEPDSKIDIMQIVLPDANGLMPWEMGCEENYVDMQPLYIRIPQGRRMN